VAAARKIRAPWWAYALLVGGITGGIAAGTTYALTRRGKDAAVQGVTTLVTAVSVVALGRVFYVELFGR
jgi:hypothetical protein